MRLAGDLLDEFIRQIGLVAAKERQGWLERCRQWQNRYPVILPQYWQEAQGVNNYVLVDVLSDEMSENDMLVPASSGAASEVTMQAFRVRGNMRVFNAQGLGSMGFGIPASLGGCLASGRRRTVCLEGDGGFQMNLQELETVRRLNLPIKFFVLNNGGYASIRATQEHYFAGRLVASSPASGLTLPDTQKLAQAYGIPTARRKSGADQAAGSRSAGNPGAGGVRSNGDAQSGHRPPAFLQPAPGRQPCFPSPLKICGLSWNGRKFRPICSFHPWRSRSRANSLRYRSVRDNCKAVDQCKVGIQKFFEAPMLRDENSPGATQFFPDAESVESES